MDLQELPPGMLSFLLQKSELSHLGPRLGQIALRGKPGIQTPNYIASTSRGVIPHLTPDNLKKHSAISALYFGLEDFIEKSPRHAPILKSSSNDTGLSRIQNFSGVPDEYLTILGPRRLPVVDCPKQNTNTSIAVSTSIGFSDLKVEDYVEATHLLRPDIVVSVADIITADVVSKRRIEKSADRSHAWLRDTVEISENDHNKRQSLIASIPPLEREQQSLYLSDLATEYHKSLSGLCLYSPETVTCIPDRLHGLPRICLYDPQTPQQVLRAISLGVDLITVPFVTKASEAGLCLSFQFPGSHNNNIGEATKSPLGFDLWSDDYAADASPLLPGCKCYACTKHHRAYIHHLLQAKEMLAWTLLQLHNFHVLQSFFTKIRESLSGSRFQEDVEKFEAIYENQLPLQTGQGPRVRGYQIKSVGGGEPKKNSKAYGRLDEQARKVEEAESGIATPTSDETADVLQEQGFASRTL